MDTDFESETNTNTVDEKKSGAREEDDKGVNLGVSVETRVSSMEIDSGGLESDGGARFLKSNRSEEVRVRVGSESKEMVSRVFEVKEEGTGFDRVGYQSGVKNDGFDDVNNRFDAKNEKMDAENDRVDDRKDPFVAQNDHTEARSDIFYDKKDRFRAQNELIEAQNEILDDPADQFRTQNDRVEDQNEQLDAQDDRFDEQKYMVSRDDRHVEVKGTVYNSLLSEFDEYVASENNGVMGSGTLRALSYGFEVGDMVWGKVKSHPWWPGHIFNEAFASPSVRRTRRGGHVLVAFFGDSSYGWFDPAELIHFDVNFAEKAKQMNSRTFVKAVEEAMDEASRRKGLGLTCKCRNPYNFRPTSVEGYYAVDVPDYEPGAVYSDNQIRKARDSFCADETLLFIKQMASAPFDTDQSGIEFVKNKATIFGFRKAVYEEFDETYLQAFGVQAARPSKDQVDVSNRPVKQLPRAPLSGPLVIAEPLGGRKSSTKPMKVKDHSKKDRYLFKRRDEPSSLNTQQISKVLASATFPSAYTGESSPIASADYVLQKRAPAVSIKSATSSQDVSGKESVIIDQASAPSSSLPTQGGTLDAKPSLDRKGVLQHIKEGMRMDVDMGPGSTDRSDLAGKGVLPVVIDGTVQSFQREGEGLIDFRHEDSSQLPGSHDRFQQPGPNISTRMDHVQDGHSAPYPSPIEAKHTGRMSAEGGVKKVKVRKRPVGEMTSDNSIMGEKKKKKKTEFGSQTSSDHQPVGEMTSDNSISGEKKKKKKKEFGSETSSDHPQKRLAIGKDGALVRKLAGKSPKMGLVSREDYNSASNSLSDSVGVLPVVGMGNAVLELPQILSDLQSLALDPFHGVQRNSPAIIKQFFLRFRSLVFQKSLAAAPPSEIEPTEVRATKSPASFASSDNAVGENVRASKLVKTLVRPDDATKAGRKRGPSDRQEEIAAKKLKKIKDVKSLASEKKASMKNSEAQQKASVKNSEVQRREVIKESVGLAPPRPVRPDYMKKADPASKATEPTMLVMKFPPQTSLPSAAELKARFARFGPIDPSSIRVFWKSFTCRVVFLHKKDAHAACKYVNGNNSLFGNVSVRCHIREMGDPATEAPESGKDTSMETAGVKNLGVLQQATVQLKSCLKKASGEEAGQVMGNRVTPRVKFMLGGEESSRGEELMIGNRNNKFNNNASYADGGGAPSSSSSSVAMDFNSKNFHKFIPSLQPPILPLPPQFAKASSHNNMHHTQVLAPRNAHNLNNTPTTLPSASTTTTTTVDISQQMLSLLTRCNDVVSKVTAMLGYVPYHPL